MRFHAPALLAFVLAAACGSAPEARPADRDAFLALGIAHAAAAPMPDLFCSGQMTQEQFARLPGVGIRRVVSLRQPSEDGTGWEEAKAKELGLEFVRIEIAGPDDLTPANAERLSKALTPLQPTLVACGSSNRVGALMAIKALQDGSSPEQALELGKKCGLTKLEPAVRKKLGL